MASTSSLLDFSDAEISAIMVACHPLQRHDRDAFLRAVAAEIAALPHRGPGSVHRAIREVQRRYFDPPNLRVASEKYR